ncbi:YbaB/EbfC family nucleoid-associated protein [Mycobacterium sp. BMJ-28]
MEFDSSVDVDGARRVGRWLAEALEQISGTARVGEQAVSGGVGRVLVSAQGRLVRLELEPKASELRSDRLAVWIEQAYVQACESAVAQVRERIKEVTAANPGLAELFDVVDRDFGRLSATLRAPVTPAQRELKERNLGPDWEEPEWDPSADPFGRNR